MNWTAFENALQSWVKTGTGLADQHVIWSEQNGARPTSTDFAVLRLEGITPVAVTDDLHQDFDGGASPGEEITLSVDGLREVSVEVQFFAQSKTGETTARAYASMAQTALELPSVVSIFRGIKASCFDKGDVQNITTVNLAAFESRARLQTRWYVRESVSEKTGYIEEVELTNYMGPPNQGDPDTIDIP